MLARRISVGSTVMPYGAARVEAADRTPSTWNSTLATPTLSVAVALKVSVPSGWREAAGAVSVATGGACRRWAC